MVKVSVVKFGIIYILPRHYLQTRMAREENVTIKYASFMEVFISVMDAVLSDSDSSEFNVSDGSAESGGQEHAVGADMEDHGADMEERALLEDLLDDDAADLFLDDVPMEQGALLDELVGNDLDDRPWHLGQAHLLHMQRSGASCNVVTFQQEAARHRALEPTCSEQRSAVLREWMQSGVNIPCCFRMSTARSCESGSSLASGQALARD